MAFQTTGARHTLGGALWSLVEPVWNPVKPQATALAESCGTLKPSHNLTSNHPAALAEPRGTLLELCWNGILPCKNSGGILMEHYLKPARTAGGTLVKPWWNPRGTFSGPRRTLEEIGPWWNPRPEHNGLVEPWWKPGGTLVEPYLKPPRTTPPLQNLVEPWQNSGGNLVEPSWNLPQTRPPQPSKKLLEPWWNPRGTLVEPLVEPWWNLSSGSPRTTPEPIWAETPKLSAVREKKKIRTGSPRSPGQSAETGKEDEQVDREECQDGRLKLASGMTRSGNAGCPAWRLTESGQTKRSLETASCARLPSMHINS